MSSLDRNSGVRDIRTPRCPACHMPVFSLASGAKRHVDPSSTCWYGRKP